MDTCMDQSGRAKWQAAWVSRTFRNKVIAGIVLLFTILGTFPIFFKIIEERNGVALNDWLLNQLPAFNMSVPIFLIMWVSTVFILLRSYQEPEIFVTFLWAYIILSVTRLLVISLVPLNPPAGLIELKDPISNTFYGLRVVTKDLFFSGHTSTVFLMFLCLKKRKDREIMLAATFLIALLLLIQHVHYTIDVLAAPFFTWLIYLSAKQFAHAEWPKK